MGTTQKYHAIKVDGQRCIGCVHCMKACPTEAIRIENGIATIREERCVDCGNCLRVCPVDAFYVEQDSLNQLARFKFRLVLFPSVMVGQFPEIYSEDQIYQALLNLGFTHIFEVEQPIQWLLDSLKNEVRKSENKPVISSFCPAIVRLIQIKYPSLTQNIVSLKAPHDLAAYFAIAELAKRGIKRDEVGIFYVSPCSAKMAAVKRPLGEKTSIVDGLINMNDLYNQIMRIIPLVTKTDTSHLRENLSSDGILWCLPRGEARKFNRRAMAIDGIHNVVKFLERLENEEVPELDFLELKSCDQGCAGGILLTGNRFVTVERLQNRAKKYLPALKLQTDSLDKAAIQKNLIADPIHPKLVFRLDIDRGKALAKLRKIDKILCQLPGIDCGGCGAPNCHALAEDMVQGSAKMTDCIFLQKRYLRDGKITIKKIFKNLDRTWGENRIEADCTKKGGRNEGF
ncbi:MAG TPA: [Fe-Fe] hydrogenase large subunit C-terminal domain-containing protein [Draconibacterium sp.]|nr:[Fe-Fe] hydrogenase large subunit C-terminal domain-containing protein [Draconibacterium sp.]